jgi:hypothetical protein
MVSDTTFCFHIPFFVKTSFFERCELSKFIAYFIFADKYQSDGEILLIEGDTRGTNEDSPGEEISKNFLWSLGLLNKGYELGLPFDT